MIDLSDFADAIISVSTNVAPAVAPEAIKAIVFFATRENAAERSAGHPHEAAAIMSDLDEIISQILKTSSPGQNSDGPPAEDDFVPVLGFPLKVRTLYTRRDGSEAYITEETEEGVFRSGDGYVYFPSGAVVFGDGKKHPMDIVALRVKPEEFAATDPMTDDFEPTAPETPCVVEAPAPVSPSVTEPDVAEATASAPSPKLINFEILVGGFYRRRDGSFVKIMRERASRTQFVFVDNNDLSYTVNGRYCSDSVDDESDIVAVATKEDYERTNIAF